jgi:phosphate transport system substrate-binding protein
MDTTGGGESGVSSANSGALERLVQNGEELKSPSFMLLRVENYGTTNIAPEDYAVPNNDLVGIRVKFPGRRVAGMMITELSDESLEPNFTRENGLNMNEDVIELPRVALNSYQHYKVLAVLDPKPEALESPELIKEPQIVGGIKGGVARKLFRAKLFHRKTGDTGAFGVIKETQSERISVRAVVTLSAFLVLIIIGQYIYSVVKPEAPLDCASGDLKVVGSTAFAPVLKEAEAMYEKTCPGATIEVLTAGSGAGLTELRDAGDKLNEQKLRDGTGDFTSPAVLAFSDGADDGVSPRLLPTPVAFSLFTMVVNKDAAVQNLSVDQIKKIYAGEITEWGQIGGQPGLPIRLVSRDFNSGTRKTFEDQVLNDDRRDDRQVREPGITSRNCRDFDTGVAPSRCERGSTNELLAAVASTPGALGYAEIQAAAGRDDVVKPLIGGQRATLPSADQGSYPFWDTEYAYTYSEPLPNPVGR